jgi:hypothetical protein
MLFVVFNIFFVKESLVNARKKIFSRARSIFFVSESVVFVAISSILALQ